MYVKDGIITWETQLTNYPSVGPDSPEYEPRGAGSYRGPGRRVGRGAEPRATFDFFD